jgi:hypothetical protein
MGVGKATDYLTTSTRIGRTPTDRNVRMNEDTPSYQPTDKLDNRAARNFLSAAAMLGHLCALYDRGVFEAGRLMSNLLFQLAVIRKGTNTPLLRQIAISDNFSRSAIAGKASYICSFLRND